MPACQYIPVLPRQGETAVKYPAAPVLAGTALLRPVLLCPFSLISCSELAAEHRVVRAENGETRLERRFIVIKAADLEEVEGPF
jgi:hypothetical protein